MILKFTQDGKFVMQIGKRGQSTGDTDTMNVHQPADVFVHAPSNELYVADGYGNQRVIVFDADNGQVQAHVGRVRREAGATRAGGCSGLCACSSESRWPVAVRSGPRSEGLATTAWSTWPTASTTGFRCSRPRASICGR